MFGRRRNEIVAVAAVALLVLLGILALIEDPQSMRELVRVITHVT